MLNQISQAFPFLQSTEEKKMYKTSDEKNFNFVIHFSVNSFFLFLRRFSDLTFIGDLNVDREKQKNESWKNWCYACKTIWKFQTTFFLFLSICEKYQYSFVCKSFYIFSHGILAALCFPFLRSFCLLCIFTLMKNILKHL